MKTAVCKVRSMSPYNQSRNHLEPHEDKESHDAYEKRTWIEKGHYDEKGNAYIPPMAFKAAISEAARMLAIPIPGKGKALYTKHFKAGILVTEGVPLGVNKKDIKPQWLSLSGRGTKGQMGVMRAFPHFDTWEGDLIVHVLDDTIPKDIFERVVKESGSFVGIGQFRPQNGGYFGRYEVVSVDWQ